MKKNSTLHFGGKNMRPHGVKMRLGNSLFLDWNLGHPDLISSFCLVIILLSKDIGYSISNLLFFVSYIKNEHWNILIYLKYRHWNIHSFQPPNCNKWLLPKMLFSHCVPLAVWFGQLSVVGCAAQTDCRKVYCLLHTGHLQPYQQSWNIEIKNKILVFFIYILLKFAHTLFKCAY